MSARTEMAALVRFARSVGLWTAVLAGVLLFFSLATVAQAVPVISGDFLFSENRGPNPLISSGHKFVLGATNITPSGPSTTVTAIHVPAGSGPDFTLNFFPGPQFPNLYAIVKQYEGEAGEWDIVATDASGSATRRTHVLDDVRILPLLTGLAVSGPVLTPHLTWDLVDPMTFPSFCSDPAFPGIFPPCVVGNDFFNYQVEVRLITGEPGNPAPPLFSSSAMPTSLPGTFDPAPTMFDIPLGVLEPDQDYLIGIRLIHNELEAILQTDPFRFFSPLENRSTAYVVYSTRVPEPSSLALLGTTLLGLAVAMMSRHRI